MIMIMIIIIIIIIIIIMIIQILVLINKLPDLPNAHVNLYNMRKESCSMFSGSNRYRGSGCTWM